MMQLAKGAPAAGRRCLAARQTLRSTLFVSPNGVQKDGGTMFSASRRKRHASRARSPINGIVPAFQCGLFIRSLRVSSRSQAGGQPTLRRWLPVVPDRLCRRGLHQHAEGAAQMFGMRERLPLTRAAGAPFGKGFFGHGLLQDARQELRLGSKTLPLSTRRPRRLFGGRRN